MSSATLRRRRSVRFTSVLALAGLLATAGIANADNAQNTADNTAGSSTPVDVGLAITYRLVGTNSPSGDVAGCNASTASPTRMTPAAPAGVTVSPTYVDITQCGNGGGQSMTFTGASAGSYTITHTITGGVSGSLYTNQLNFTLIVTESGSGGGEDPVNTAPEVTDVTVTPTDACTVDLVATFTDPDADTWTATVNWDAPGGTPEDAIVDGKTVTASHTYGAAGVYDILVTVNDGTDSGTGTASFATLNTPSSILAPINTIGKVSTFKIGSSIPVKITVVDCGEDDVSTLTVMVALAKIDGTASEPVNEVASTSTPTSGTDMRWTTDLQYIYNLSTKNSQFTGGPLTAGTYRVTLSDPSFFADPTAVFDLKK